MDFCSLIQIDLICFDAVIEGMFRDWR